MNSSEAEVHIMKDHDASEETLQNKIKYSLFLVKLTYSESK